jgi:hypothetical protein
MTSMQKSLIFVNKYESGVQCRKVDVMTNDTIIQLPTTVAGTALTKRCNPRYSPSGSSDLVLDVVVAALDVSHASASDVPLGLGTVEQGGGLLEGKTTGLDDEEVAVHELEGDPNDVDDLEDNIE